MNLADKVNFMFEKIKKPEQKIISINKNKFKKK